MLCALKKALLCKVTKDCRYRASPVAKIYPWAMHNRSKRINTKKAGYLPTARVRLASCYRKATSKDVMKLRSNTRI